MKKKGGGGGGANWMDTYGDMVTLLLCFFVLLFSMATFSEEKWQTIVVSFNPDAAQAITETSGNDGPFADPNTENGSGMGLSQAEIDKNMDALYEAIQDFVSKSGSESSISVTQGDGKVFISFNDTVFFNGNDWALREESKPILEEMAHLISNVAGAVEEIRVIGHTAQQDPNQPNDPVVDRLLSAQRAANVLAYVQGFTTVSPGRMVSEGCGQWRPVADNTTAEGRSKNRRVEMIISGRNIQDELSQGIQQHDSVVVK